MSRCHRWWQVTRLYSGNQFCQVVNSQFVCAVASSLNVKKDVKEWRKEDSAWSNQDLWSQISSLDEMFECTLGTHPSLSQPSSSPVHYWCPNCASLLLLNTSLIDIIRCKNVQKSASIASSHHPLQTAKCLYGQMKWRWFQHRMHLSDWGNFPTFPHQCWEPIYWGGGNFSINFCTLRIMLSRCLSEQEMIR